MINIRSQRFKIAVTIFCLVTAVISLCSWALISSARSAGEARINAREENLIELITQTTRSALLTNEFDEAQLFIDRITQHSAVDTVLLANAADTIVAGSSFASVGEKLPRERLEREGWRLAPVVNQAGKLGTVAVRFNRSDQEREARSLIRTSLLLTPLILILSLSVSALMGKALARRLERLVFAAQRAAAGDLDVTVDEKGGDEVSAVAAAFNRMIVSLRTTLGDLSSREELYRGILTTTQEGFLLSDREGRILETNEAYCTMTGFSVEEILNRRLWDFDAGTTPEECETRTARIIREGKDFYETRHRRRDGGVIDVEVSVTTLSHAGLRIVSFIRDITGRKQAERDLMERTERLNQLMQTTDQGIYGIDMDGNCTFINRAGLEMLGYRFEECVGRNMHWLIHHSHGDGTPYAVEGCPIYQAMVTGSGSRVTGEVLWRKDGTSFPVEYSSYPIREEGVIRGTVVTFSDITERLRAEEERNELLLQLQQAQKMESIGRLAGGVAHDFNNMLAVIMGHAEMALLRLEPGHPVRPSIVEISRAAERSASLTRQLLAFARKQTIAPRPLDLNKLIEGMLSMLQRLIGERITISLHAAPGLWTVQADPSQIDQIMVNLCVNARDAITDAGRIDITTANAHLSDAEARNLDIPPGEYVAITVADDGCGIDHDTLPRIFEPFYTTKEKGAGTGLGLATVFGAVRQNGGGITVTSEPGRGSTFTLYLPRFHEESPESVEREDAIETEESGGTILLVEDEPAIVELVTTMLQELGYRVLNAAGPDEAIALSRKSSERIDLLLTDVIMPGMNGKDLAGEIKTLHPGLRVVYMSGYTADIISRLGVLEEGITFIPKPFTMAELSRTVRAALGSR